MLGHILDGLFSSVGFGQSLLQKRAARLSSLQQSIAYVIGILFWGVAAIVVATASNSVRETWPWWLLLPICFFVFYVLFEIGFWIGIVLVEPRGDKNTEADEGTNQ